MGEKEVINLFLRLPTLKMLTLLVKWLKEICNGKKFRKDALAASSERRRSLRVKQETKEPLSSSEEFIEKIQKRKEDALLAEGSSNFYLSEGSENSYTTIANQNFKSVGEFPSKAWIFQSMVENQKIQNERVDLWIKKMMNPEFVALEIDRIIKQEPAKLKVEKQVTRKLTWKEEEKSD